jgi:hypothetical protein
VVTDVWVDVEVPSIWVCVEVDVFSTIVTVGVELDEDVWVEVWTVVLIVSVSCMILRAM